MLNLLKKEINLSMKSIIFLLCIVIITIMYITQCLPHKWYYYTAPMDEMHLFYTVMKEDYKDGHTGKHNSLDEIQLNKETKVIMSDFINQMNPDVKDNEDIQNIIFNISYEEFQNKMELLNQALGGWSYYDIRYRYSYYMYYCSNAFGTNFLTGTVDIIHRMEEFLDITIKLESYTKYDEFIGKNVGLTDKQINELEKISNIMKEEKQSNLTTNELYEKYNSWYIIIDNMLGGNTFFGEKYRLYALQVDDSLDVAFDKYISIRDDDKITNAYARYYSDYFSILAGILPAFIAAFALIEDRRWKMHEFIYPRIISSMEYVFTKFLAIIFLFGIYFYFLAGISTFLFNELSIKYCLNIDYFAFFKYTTFWVLPTVFITTALSMFLSIVFMNGVIPIMFQLIIFFLSSQKLIGEYKIFKPIIRFNKIGMVDIYNSNLHNIIINRIFITFASFLIIYLTAKLYSNIRNGGNIFSHWRKNNVHITKI